MEKENKEIMMRFEWKADPVKRSVDTMMVRKNMEGSDGRGVIDFFFDTSPPVSETYGRCAPQGGR